MYKSYSRACLRFLDLVAHGQCGRSASRHILKDRLKLLQMRVQAESLCGLPGPNAKVLVMNRVTEGAGDRVC